MSVQLNPPSAVAILTIAGSDSSGGAGIQADLKTGAACGVFVATAITAITAQNSAGISGIFPLPPEQVIAQCDAVLKGMPIKAIKLGMLANVHIASAVAQWLSSIQVPLIVDPVLRATSGAELTLDADILHLYRDRLMPMACVSTPNVKEASILLDCDLAQDYDSLEHQARTLFARTGSPVLLKGGDTTLPLAVDYLAGAQGVMPFSSPRQHTDHTHGGGCTLATAIAAFLAQNMRLEAAVAAAKTYIQGAIQHSGHLNLAAKNGPIHHFYQYW